jgi:hypothetical protein
MMQMLERGGVPPLSDDVRAPDASNPRGYFEFEPVKRLRSDRSWLEQAQGRAVKIIHLLLRELPTDRGLRYRVILMKRSIDEVLASQHEMLQRQGKPSAAPDLLGKIYATQLAEVEDWLGEQPAFHVLSVAHSSVLADPLEEAARVNAFLGGGLDVAAMATAVDPALHRQRAIERGKND